MNSDWFHEAGWGVFTHWCKGAASPDEYNARVDAFDVDLLVQQLVEIGTPYYFITLGQCSGYYCAPNPTYDAVVGYEQSHCSRRDLVSDIATALAPHGIRLMLYLASEGPAGDPAAARKFMQLGGQTLGWDMEMRSRFSSFSGIFRVPGALLTASLIRLGNVRGGVGRCLG